MSGFSKVPTRHDVRRYQVTHGHKRISERQATRALVKLRKGETDEPTADAKEQEALAALQRLGVLVPAENSEMARRLAKRLGK